MADKYISAEALTLSLRDDYELNAASFARVKRHVEAAPDMVKRGEWKLVGADKRGRGGSWVCSNCKRHYPYKCDFCPNCGADMRGAEDGK